MRVDSTFHYVKPWHQFNVRLKTQMQSKFEDTYREMCSVVLFCPYDQETEAGMATGGLKLTKHSVTRKTATALFNSGTCNLINLEVN